MGFFDGFKDEGGLNYVDAEEKAAIIKNATPLEVVRVFAGTGTYGSKYTMVFLLEGEERAISFGAVKEDGTGVPSRDRMFEAMIEYFATEPQEGEEHENPVVKLVKPKQAVLVKNAEGE